jgi:hypothetical protein
MDQLIHMTVHEETCSGTHQVCSKVKMTAHEVVPNNSLYYAINLQTLIITDRVYPIEHLQNMAESCELELVALFEFEGNKGLTPISYYPPSVCLDEILKLCPSGMLPVRDQPNSVQISYLLARLFILQQV